MEADAAIWRNKWTVFPLVGHFGGEGVAEGRALRHNVPK